MKLELDLSNVQWRKASASQGAGGACVEIATGRWRKASASQGPNGNCVEVAGFGVRDSKDPSGPVLTFDASEWSAFVAGVRAGDIP